MSNRTLPPAPTFLRLPICREKTCYSSCTYYKSTREAPMRRRTNRWRDTCARPTTGGTRSSSTARAGVSYPKDRSLQPRSSRRKSGSRDLCELDISTACCLPDLVSAATRTISFCGIWISSPTTATWSKPWFGILALVSWLLEYPVAETSAVGFFKWHSTGIRW